MNLIKGQNVTLYTKTQNGTDDFNAPIYVETQVVVNDVLIEPMSNDAIANEFGISGKKVVYTLHIPKTDEHDWKDCVVEFYGSKYKAFGDCLMYDARLTPLRWNKKIKVERYE